MPKFSIRPPLPNQADSSAFMTAHPLTSAPSLTVFVYHSVTDCPKELDRQFDLNVPPAVFNRQIQIIRTHFRCIDPLRIMSGDIPPRSALITFDDGQQSVFRNALPILSHLGVPSLIFLNMGPVRGEVFRSALIQILCQREDFLHFLERRTGRLPEDRPAFLRCSPEVMDEYLETTGEDLRAEVEDYWGPFASADDLKSAAADRLVHFGNHLYNHDVPALLSDSQLLDSFRRNAEALSAFPNTCNAFAFPFGEPDECFTRHQVSLLLANGAGLIFTCAGGTNFLPFGPCLDRLQIGPAQDSWHLLADHVRQSGRA
jgi:peptidoglycan/xylan/chitin deacetylase (PgdA/CDA1 family)